MLMTPHVRPTFRPALTARLASCTPPGSPPAGRTFSNPLVIQKGDGSQLETCADPDILRGPAGYRHWTCTAPPGRTTQGTGTPVGSSSST